MNEHTQTPVEMLILTAHERDLLRVLYRSKGRVCTRNFLLDACLTEGCVEPRSIDTRIKKLRQALTRNDIDLRIKTARGEGYYIETTAPWPFNGGKFNE